MKIAMRTRTFLTNFGPLLQGLMAVSQKIYIWHGRCRRWTREVQKRLVANCDIFGQLYQSFSCPNFCASLPHAIVKCNFALIAVCARAIPNVCALSYSMGVDSPFLYFRDIKTRQDKTRQDKTRQDKTRQDKTRQDKARQDKTRHDTIRHGMARHDTTRRDKTRHDTTRHDTTRHDKVVG
jgi:hypothetical protein